jgi:hypothetical protein
MSSPGWRVVNLSFDKLRKDGDGDGIVVALSEESKDMTGLYASSSDIQWCFVVDW